MRALVLDLGEIRLISARGRRDAGYEVDDSRDFLVGLGHRSPGSIKARRRDAADSRGACA